MTLLEKAKQTPTTKHPKGRSNKGLREKCELTLAWIKGEVTAEQAAAVLNVSAKSLQGRVAHCVVTGIRAGLIQAEMVSEVRE